MRPRTVGIAAILAAAAVLFAPLHVMRAPAAEAATIRADHAEISPTSIARAHVRTHHARFGLTAESVDRLDVIRSTPLPGTSDATIVMFRQRFGQLPAGGGRGLIVLGVRGTRVVFISSSLYGKKPALVRVPRKIRVLPGVLTSAGLTPSQAWRRAASAAGRPTPSNAIRVVHKTIDPTRWTTLDVAGFGTAQHVRLVALDGRPAYEVNVLDVETDRALAATSYVDAATGTVLRTDNRVDELIEKDPAGELGGRSCPLIYLRCEIGPLRAELQRRPVAVRWTSDFARPRLADDGRTQSESVIVRAEWGDGTLRQAALPEGNPLSHRPLSSEPTFADAWHQSGCGIDSLDAQRGDIDTSALAAFALSNSLHDWSYDLGFTETTGNLQDAGVEEGDPQLARVQLGASTGGYPSYRGRNQAHQITLQDGFPGMSGLTLFQPVAGRWYGPCTDSALDPTVVAHEYAHAITSRLVGGPDAGITSEEGHLVSEAWSDVLAAQYTSERTAFVQTPAIGGYVSGNPMRGIRAYSLGANPLGYADLGRDSLLDREIWSAVMWDIRSAMLAQYPDGDRRWVRLLVDSLQLQQSEVTMLGARNALLGADRLRYDGENADLMWREFAKRGFGSHTRQGHPDYTAPGAAAGSLTLDARDNDTGDRIQARFVIGSSADGIASRSKTSMVPGSYNVSWSAPGYGIGHTTATITAGETTKVRLRLDRNLVTGRKSLAPLTDGRENTAWTTALPGGTSVLDLGKPGTTTDRHRIGLVTLSAMTPEDRVFTSARQVAIDACVGNSRRFSYADEEKSSPCKWMRVFTSPPRQADRPRPVPAELGLRSYEFEPVTASQVRLTVLSTQCTGNPAFLGEQENDPLSASDCLASPSARTASIAELGIYPPPEQTERRGT